MVQSLVEEAKSRYEKAKFRVVDLIRFYLNFPFTFIVELVLLVLWLSICGLDLVGYGKMIRLPMMKNMIRNSTRKL